MPIKLHSTSISGKDAFIIMQCYVKFFNNIKIEWKLDIVPERINSDE